MFLNSTEKFCPLFDDQDYYTKIEHGVLKISHGRVSMAKGSKICRLYILYNGSNVIGHSLLVNEDFYDRNEP